MRLFEPWARVLHHSLHAASAKLLPKLGDDVPIEVAVGSLGGSFVVTEDNTNRTRTQRQLDSHVNYAFRIKDPHTPGATIPVVGGGGKMKVTLGDGGKLVGCCGTWRPIKPSTNGADAPDGPDIYVGAMYAYNSGTTSPRNDHLWGHGSVAPDPESPNVRVCMWTQT